MSGLSSSVFILMAHLVAHHPELLHSLHLGAATVSMPVDGAAGGLLRHLAGSGDHRLSVRLRLDHQPVRPPPPLTWWRGWRFARIPYDRFVRWVPPFIIGAALILMVVLVGRGSAARLMARIETTTKGSAGAFS